MSVHVTMKMKDGRTDEKDCRGWIEAAAYVETQRGQYTEVSAVQIHADEIRQGGNGNG
jgi:hypothetical protein